jgi:hypothetical protein
MIHKNKISLDTLLEQFVQSHGNTYDYSKVDYLGNNHKVEIICKKHGSFFQWPSDHKNSIGCSKCSGNYRISQEEFIQRVKIIHGNTYLFDNAVFSGRKKKVHVICKIHGDFFASAGNLLQGGGCQKCGYKKQTMTKVAKGIITDPNKVDAFVAYRRQVRDLSNRNFVKYYHDINPLNLRRGKDFHLDHIVSIMCGFSQNIPYEEIAAPSNLRIIPALDNIKKGIKISNEKSEFNSGDIKTQELNSNLLYAIRLKLSNKYQITDIETNNIIVVESITNWCAEHNFSVSSARWASSYQKTPFKKRYIIEKL